MCNCLYIAVMVGIKNIITDLNQRHKKKIMMHDIYILVSSRGIRHAENHPKSMDVLENVNIVFFFFF